MFHRLEGSKGKLNADYNTQDFYKFYCKHATDRIPRDTMRKVFQDCTKATQDYVLDGYSIRVRYVGRFYIKVVKMDLLDENGNMNTKLPVDWKRTTAYWKKKYEGKNNIKDIPNKPLLRHVNDQTDNHIGVIYFRRLRTLPLRRWKFIACTKFKRRASKVLREKTNKLPYLLEQ